MPSFPRSSFAELEEMMSQQLFNLDLREQNRQVSSLNLATRTPGFMGQPPSCSAPLPPSEASESVFLSPAQWGQQSQSPLPSHFPSVTQWAKQGFLSQRSVSLVETAGGGGSCLSWPGSETKNLPSEQGSPAALAPPSASSSRYKTELCRSFTENGLCKYGAKCQFAHGPEELRDLSRHPKYKTEPCRTFHTIGFCPYGIRCHFVHNNEEEKKAFSRSSSSSSSSSCLGAAPQALGALAPSRPHRPPLLRQSFSFAGFPSAPPNPAPSAAPLALAPSESPPSCADITELLSQAFLEMGSSPSHHFQPPLPLDPHSPFLPSPDSGCSPSGLSPSASPSLRQSPGTSGAFGGPLGSRSLSFTSLSDQDQDQDQDQEQDGSSSASSLIGSESCCGGGGGSDGSGKRLAVFSQLSVPDDAAAFCL